jgi:hypothetical protein
VYSFAAKVALDAPPIEQGDVDALRALGLRDTEVTAEVSSGSLGRSGRLDSEGRRYLAV